jgi:hypothetical protein
MRSPALLHRLTCLGLFAFLAACGSGGGGGGTTGSGAGDTGAGNDDGGSGSDPVLVANFESILANVLVPQCTNCHVGATAPLGLRLDADNAYALLVGVASSQQPSLLRVDPGNPNDSYLIRKLEGTAATGGQMPLGDTPLAQADIDVIRQWILDGALPPEGQAPSEPIRVSSLDPLPDAVVPMLPMSVMAIFDRELNATTVDATTFLVERSGGDGTFDDGNEVGITPVSITVPQMNPQTAVFDMSTTTPVTDTYRVTLIGSGPATIQDLGGNSLDGEFSGAFPSGDATAGGNFTAEFVVEGIQPTLSSIQDNLFAPTCSGCHTGPSGAALPAGLDLTSLSMSFMDLVGVSSVQNAALNRVEPGDPDASYLIQKLEGTASSGSRMPPLGAAIDQATIDVVRQWITDGAAM